MEKYFEEYSVVVARLFPNVTKKFLLELDNKVPSEDLCLTIASDNYLLQDLKQSFFQKYQLDLVQCLDLILIR